ncbi:MAG: polysaccharide biosynthesis tyrosine autokinase [Ktedonobacteraceae bacterium]|nr:polysaccharide biosynthesis tyrosine autokinase [Ktedonobacteraceae bacterium]
MQLQHYIELIWRRLWLILIGIALCTGATYIISNRAAPIYEASAFIQVIAPGTSNGGDVFSNQALAVGDALLVTSDDVLHTAAKSLPGVTFAQLQKAVSASPADNTQLIQVRGDAATPALATAITNTVAQTFIQHQVESETARLQGTANLLSQQLVTAKTNVDQAQAKLSTLQQNNAPAAQINQQTDLLNTYQLNYNSLLTNYNDIQLQKATMARSLTLVQPATPPAQPLGSRTLLNTVIAAAMSLLLMVILVLLLDWADATIKTPEDVARLALLEPLGSIPLRTTDSNAQMLSELALHDDQLERAFAIIHTNFTALNAGQRSLLVTSLQAHTGTTTVATRLALALAQSGTRVLLVDAHIRKPVLHNTFNLPNTRGLATCQADVHVLQKQPTKVYSWLNQWTTTEPNLWLLPAGNVTGSPTALLRSLELRKLVGWLLREQVDSGHTAPSPVDIIIFDTPALDEEADTIILAPLCDSSILVIEAGKERKEALQKAQATLKRLGAPILGVVINRQKASHRSYLYINQPQQGVFPGEASSQEHEVKYPLLKVQTLSMRTMPKTSAGGSVPQKQEAFPPDSRMNRFNRAEETIEASNDLKVDRDKTPIRHLSGIIVPAPGKNQGGKQG